MWRVAGSAGDCGHASVRETELLMKGRKFKGGWNQVNFEEDAGVVRVGWNNGEYYQSMRERPFKTFRQAKVFADGENRGSDQFYHFPVRRAFLRKKQ